MAKRNEIIENDEIIRRKKELIAPLMGIGDKSVEEVAEILGVSPEELSSLNYDSSFVGRRRREASQSQSRNWKDFRLIQYRIIIYYLNREINKRLLRGDLGNLSFQDLIVLQSNIAKEMRLDVQDEQPDTVEGNYVDDIKKRFVEAQKHIMNNRGVSAHSGELRKFILNDSKGSEETEGKTKVG